MAYPTMAGTVATTVINTIVTAQAVNMPTSIAAGERILVLGRLAASATFTDLQGFTLRGTYGTTGSSTSLLDKVATGSEPATYTFTIGAGSVSLWAAFRLTHVSGTPLYDSGSGGTDATVPYDMLGHTTGQPQCYVLFAGSDTTGGTHTFSLYGANQFLDYTGGFARALYATYGEQATAGATGTNTMTLSTATRINWLSASYYGPAAPETSLVMQPLIFY